MVTQKYTKYSLIILAIFFVLTCTLKVYAAAESSDDFARALHAKFATEE